MTTYYGIGWYEDDQIDLHSYGGEPFRFDSPDEARESLHRIKTINSQDKLKLLPTDLFVVKVEKEAARTYTYCRKTYQRYNFSYTPLI